MRVGLIGYGAIGRGLARLVRERATEEVRLVGALVRDAARPRGEDAPPLVGSVDELLALGPEVVAECAGHEALRAHVPAVLRAGCDVVALSVGALADPALEAEVRAATVAGRARLRIASGAIGGLDALAAGALGGLDRVTHTTRKPARALLGAEAVGLDAPRELYRGPAREGVRLFPESVNVAAAVSLAGIGFDRTELVVVADPALDRNTHIVEAEGAFGRFRFEIANFPTENPRTGRIVAMSLLRALLARSAPILIG